MPKLTKRQFEEMFREEVLPYIAERFEQDGIPDKPARREAWNDTVDAYIRDRVLPETAGNWSHPRGLETWRVPMKHHATKKSAERPYGTSGSLAHVRGVRAREIVRLAAEQVKDPSARFWLLADERGTFEKAARKYLEETADKAKTLGMTNAKVNEEIAVMLALSAAEAFLKRTRSKR